jgi:hypothetical protein
MAFDGSEASSMRTGGILCTDQILPLRFVAHDIAKLSRVGDPVHTQRPRVGAVTILKIRSSTRASFPRIGLHVLHVSWVIM